MGAAVARGLATPVARLLETPVRAQGKTYKIQYRDAKRFSVTYDQANACTEIVPLTKAWRKEHFFHEKVLDLETEGGLQA